MENLVNHSVGPRLLDDTDYETYSEAWRTFIEEAIQSSPALDLAPLFHDQTGQCISSLSFPIDTLQYLVSTPGANFIKVRFILLPSLDPLTHSHFSAVMFAADSSKEHPYPGEGRLSAYYLATPYWEASPVAQAAATLGFSRRKEYAHPNSDTTLAAGASDSSGDGSDQDATVLPHDLARIWLRNWQHEALTLTITPNRFTTSTQKTLRGYNFTLRDFIEALMLSQPMKSAQDVRLIFGIRQHFMPTTPSRLANTFGVAARIYDTESGKGTSASPFFDLATPCPPTH